MEPQLTLRGCAPGDFCGNYHSHGIFHLLQEEENKIVLRRKKVEVFKKDNIHFELQTPIFLANMISLLPVCGILNSDPNNLRFRWKSFKVFYCFLVVFFQIFLSVLTIMNYAREGVSFRNFGDILFYCGTMFSSIMFLNLARGWKDFIGQWLVVQNSMNDLEKIAIIRRIQFITIALALSSICEHLLSNSETFMNFGDAEGNRLEMFLETRHMQVFRVFNYTTAFGICIYLINVLITMIWNYTDIFLTVVSLCLAKMFKQFSRDLESTASTVTKENSLTYWKKRREIYSRLALLVKLVDDKLSVMILFSFAVNLYFICIQLLSSIYPICLVKFIYFSCSFGHLILRTCAVCMSASRIYENSKEPLQIIFSLPSELYNIEVQRLQTQISTEVLALTGCNFFTVTRTLLLTIAGTIVTYEIVMVQFGGLANPTDCTPTQ